MNGAEQMFCEKELVAIAKRENNKKRSYLVVDPLQGKHIPVSPSKALSLFAGLADKVKDAYGNEKILFIGFAETATAIGSQLAICVGGKYIQTTREPIAGVNYLFFSEAHSHATEQKLVKEDIEYVINDVDRVIFVEDEVTTGNTILGIISIMKKEYGENIKFSVASLLNGMNEEHLKVYRDLNINLHYLVKTNHDGYARIADKYADNGEYNEPDYTESQVELVEIDGLVNARRIVDTSEYSNKVEKLWNRINEAVSITQNKRYLVVGTEEFMYPALYVGSKIEEMGCDVRSHSTTRSPIVVSTDAGYPLRERFELRSLYDDERTTFLYNIDKYDAVIVITDSGLNSMKGAYSLINALKKYNDNITLIRWY